MLTIVDLLNQYWHPHTGLVIPDNNHSIVERLCVDCRGRCGFTLQAPASVFNYVAGNEIVTNFVACKHCDGSGFEPEGSNAAIRESR